MTAATPVMRVLLLMALALVPYSRPAAVAAGAGPEDDMASGEQGHLTARPRSLAPESETPPFGLSPLGLDRGRDGLVRAPPSYRPDRPAPLLVMLHGAGGDARQVLPTATRAADEFGVLVLAPDARGPTWDVILGGYGPDVRFLDRALARVFARYAVDPARVAIGGFSDGASYALSLGLANGDLFTGGVLAFSPGFVAAGRRRGSPRVFVSHGVHDAVLPIDRTSRQLVPSLRRGGHDVAYHEFDGGHAVPPHLIREAISRFLDG